MTRSIPAPSARPPIRLTAQVLTCLMFCVLAVPIIWFGRDDPLAAFGGPMSPLRQLLIGQGLALLAAAGSYVMFRLTARAKSTTDAIASYARLDLRGLNPLWIALAAAIGEETLFRAALQPLLGIWITSLVFVATHTPAYRFRRLDFATLAQAAGVFGGSVVLGLIYQYVGWIAAVLVHLWIDIIGLLIVRAAARAQ
jgi:membrane protease YdiL (CAAX protease family)